HPTIVKIREESLQKTHHQPTQLPNLGINTHNHSNLNSLNYQIVKLILLENSSLQLGALKILIIQNL
ncbi:MAG: hypothetical protein ACYTX0_57280, partial [Nostoc sp.]